MSFAQAVFAQCWPNWQQYFGPEVGLRLGAVVISTLDDCTPGAAASYLSPEELNRWTGFSQKKRSLEWLGGRLAAKFTAAGFLGAPKVDWQNLVVWSEKNGRPYLRTETGPQAPFISISHSGPMAAAMAANLPCGLDIQQPGPRIHRVKERFAFPEEEDILSAFLPGSLTETQRLTMLWATKEAIRKMVQAEPLLGLLEIRLLAVHDGRGTPQDPLAMTFSPGRKQDGCPSSITVLTFFADNLAWALTCLQNLIKE